MNIFRRTLWFLTKVYEVILLIFLGIAVLFILLSVEVTNAWKRMHKAIKKSQRGN